MEASVLDLLTIGSISQYTKATALKTQWKLKKQSGNFTAHGKSLQDYVSFTKASDLLPDTEEQDQKLASIITKAEAGKKLTEDEWEYLKAKSPELYAKLREVEREAESHEEALRRCKTRDEALRLHVAKLGEILAAAKNGDSGALLRLSRMTQTMTAFTESEEYHELPTEAEEAIERESERRAELEALLEELGSRQAEREIEDGDADDTRQDSEEDSTVFGRTAEQRKAEPDVKEASGNEAKRPLGADSSPGETAPAPDSLSIVRRAPGRKSAQPRSAATSNGEDTASAVPSGHRAYLEQQSDSVHDRPRRRVIDTEA